MLRLNVRGIATATAIAMSAAGLSACATASATPESVIASGNAAQSEAAITRQDVEAAQQAWGKALVQIATTYDSQGLNAARTVASNVIDTAYGYNLGPVLFKPTLTVAPQTFRTTREGALAYFVGHDANFPADTGFALKGWRSYQIENAAVFIDGDVAISMGKVRITDKSGNVTEVDKTWGWKKDANGQMRIVLHHSSLPYRPN
jgi:hypothetical protein